MTTLNNLISLLICFTIIVLKCQTNKEDLSKLTVNCCVKWVSFAIQNQEWSKLCLIELENYNNVFGTFP